MTLGEKIRKYRLLHDLKQKDLGMMIGFSPATADSRIRKYEGDIMAPKSEIRNKLIQALDVDPSALSEIDIRSNEDIVRVFFFMEDCLGLEVEKIDFDNFNFNQEKVSYEKREIQTLNSYMYIWQQQKKNLLSTGTGNEKDSLREYELWKSRFPRDIHNYWNSLSEKIDSYYSPLVNSFDESKEKIVCSSDFLTQIRKMIGSGPDFKVGSESRLRNKGYLTFTFQISELLTPASKEAETQFAEFLYDLKTLESYGMTIDRTILTSQTGNSITYHLLLNPLMTKDSIIEELIEFEKNKETMNDFSIEMFEKKFNNEFHAFNLNLQEEIKIYYQNKQ